MALVPKDVRAGRDFQIVKGVAEMLRTSITMNDPDNDSFDQGEVVGINIAGEAVKAAGSVGTPDLNARISWTKYVPADTNNGQTDALATKALDVLSGPYQFKVTSAFFVEQGSAARGDILYGFVSGGVGKLYNEPAATASLTELAPGVAVARVISWDGTTLWAESLQ